MGGSQIILGVVEGLRTRLRGLEEASWGPLPTLLPSLIPSEQLRHSYLANRTE